MTDRMNRATVLFFNACEFNKNPMQVNLLVVQLIQAYQLFKKV